MHLKLKGTLLLLTGAVTTGLLTGCAGLPKHLTTTTRIETPPPGKALVNFHRPTGYGGQALYPIFDGDGTFICDMPGKSIFQYVCPPGKHLFIGWAEHVTVVEADLAPDKVYDIMVDVSMGWIRANIWMDPLEKGDPRRAELAKFAKREKKVLAIQNTDHVREYQAKNQEHVEEIKQDFLKGEKSERVKRLSPDDCR